MALVTLSVFKHSEPPFNIPSHVRVLIVSPPSTPQDDEQFYHTVHWLQVPFTTVQFSVHAWVSFKIKPFFPKLMTHLFSTPAAKQFEVMQVLLRS